MSALTLIKSRIDMLECPICGATVIDADEFKCIEDKNISQHKIWVCKKHRTE